MLTTALIESLIANYLKSSDGYGIEFCMKAASLCSEIVKDTVTKAAQGVLSASDTEVKTIADNILNDLHSHWMETPSHIVEITSRLAEAIAEKGGDVFDEQGHLNPF